MCDEPNWELQRLSIVFRPGGLAEDPFNKRDDDDRLTRIIRRHVFGELATCTGNIFAYQHRTKLFQLFVNGNRFRFLRWDRSGIIVTDPVDYVNNLAGTRLLLEFLDDFSQLSDAAQGRDHTAVRVQPSSCGWMRMDVLAFYHGDVDHTERSGVTSDESPANFAFPKGRVMLQCLPCSRTACVPIAKRIWFVLYRSLYW